MKKIQTKSFSDPIKKSDGLRICVMRRYKPEYQFDCWLPILAPTETLLTQYVKEKTIGWKTFSRRYTKQILDKHASIIRCLVKMKQITTITLLCCEEEETYCHRVLIKRACEQELLKQNLRSKISK